MSSDRYLEGFVAGIQARGGKRFLPASAVFQMGGASARTFVKGFRTQHRYQADVYR
jgi:hypothetical protein